MTPIKRKLLYIFRGTLLRLRISWGHGKTLTLSVGYHVDRTDSKGKPKWDGSRCVRNTTHGKDKVPAATINKVLEQLEDKVGIAFYEFEHNDLIPSPEQLKTLLNPEKENIRKNTISKLVTIYRSEQAIINQWSDRTRRLVKQALDNFIETFGSEKQIDTIGNDGLLRLLEHMTTKDCYDFRGSSQKISRQTAQINHGYNNETINRYMAMIRAFMRWCIEKGYIKDSPILSKSKPLKVTKLPVIFLTMEELQKFQAVDITGMKAKIRDGFLFCCFTGLRYSDLKQLKWNQVKEDYIEIVTQKTHDRLIIELNKYSRKILSKYKRGKDNDNVFYVNCNSDYNKVTKEIAKMAGINDPIEAIFYIGSERKSKVIPKWSLITSHTPRKTFVTQALSMGISANIVMKWTGHKSLKAMQPYIEIISKAKKENMDRFNQLDLLNESKDNE